LAELYESTVNASELERAISPDEGSGPLSPDTGAADRASHFFAVKYAVTRLAIPPAADSHRSSEGVNHFDEDKREMSTRVPAIEFDLEGFKCVRFFAPGTNQLCVSGPKGCMDAGLQYSMKYGALYHNLAVRNFLALIKAETDMERKLHAMLHVMEKYKPELGEEKEIGHEHVIEALAELGPWKFIDPKGWG
jgi:hypothetical protein